MKVQIDVAQQHPGGVTIGVGRNDGINRVYWSDNNGWLTEYTWNGTSWDKVQIPPATGYDGVIIGPGRNDGVNRIYAERNDKLYEITYSGCAWTRVEIIPNPPPPAGRYYAGIHIGYGRNDGVNRVYVNCMDRKIYELTYNSSATKSKTSI